MWDILAALELGFVVFQLHCAPEFVQEYKHRFCILQWHNECVYLPVHVVAQNSALQVDVSCVDPPVSA